jgi:carbon monoxide dehydrogenase subunit G
VKLEGEHHFKSSRAEVWRALQDPQTLANSLPGVKRLEVDGPDRYTVTVTVGVGAVKGAYDGTFALTDKHELESCRVTADASGPPGSVSATAAMTLADADGGGTVLAYDADAKVTGPLAGIGQRMVASAAKKTTKEFLEAIDRELTGVNGASAPASPNTAAATKHVAADSAVSGPIPGPPPAGVFSPSSPAGGDGGDRELKLLTGGLVAGFLLAILGVLVGRRTAR